MWQQTADSEEDSDVEVAVKTMEEGAGEEERVKFLQEAAIMGQFRSHPNIVRILGIILDAPVSNNTGTSSGTRLRTPLLTHETVAPACMCM